MKGKYNEGMKVLYLSNKSRCKLKRLHGPQILHTSASSLTYKLVPINIIGLKRRDCWPYAPFFNGESASW